MPTPRGPIRESVTELTFVGDGNPSLIYIGTNRQPYRLDDGEVPADERELAIMKTLLRLGGRYAADESDRMAGKVPDIRD